MFYGGVVPDVEGETVSGQRPEETRPPVMTMFLCLAFVAARFAGGRDPCRQSVSYHPARLPPVSGLPAG